MESSTTTTVAGTVMLTSGASGRVSALLSIRALKSLVLLIKAFVLFVFLLPIHLGLSGFGFRTIKQSSSSSEDKDNKTKKGRKIGGGLVMVPLPHQKGNSRSVVVVEKKNFKELEAAARREIAIRRATDSMVSLFLTSRGDTLFTQSWSPTANKIRGLVVLVHGLNEHSGRYSDFAKKLNANGFKVYGMDWIGHGGSDGLHAYVHSLDYAVSDLQAFLEQIVAENSELPCFCFGHSTGGAIVLKSILDSSIKDLVKGVVLTSPAVRVQASHPIVGVLAPVFSYLLPRYQFSAANKNGTIVSRDPEALIAKYSDPLVYTGSIRVRTGYEILRISSYLQQNLERLTTPFLVLHGTCDAVTDPDASVELYEKAPAADKSIKLYKGLLHDLLFEPEREVVAKDIIEWLNSRV